MWDWGWWSYDSLGWMEWAYGIDGMGYWNWRYPWSMPAQERPFGFRNGEVYVQDIRDKDAFKEVNPQDPKKIKFGRPAAPPFPLPGSYKSGLKALMADLKKGDPIARESFLAQGRFTSLTDRAGLMEPDLRGKALPFASFPTVVKTPPAGQTWSSYYAAVAARPRVIDVPAGGGSGIVPYPDQPRNQAPAMASRAGAGSGLRTIDWNPDVRFAQKMGVQLRYVSGRNEILCPELNMTSANSRYNPENRQHAGSFIESTSGSGSSSGGTSSGEATSSGTASSGSATSTGTSTGSTGTTTGHVIKK
jgi:hypothetical protein